MNNLYHLYCFELILFSIFLSWLSHKKQGSRFTMQLFLPAIFLILGLILGYQAMPLSGLPGTSHCFCHFFYLLALWYIQWTSLEDRNNMAIYDQRISLFVQLGFWLRCLILIWIMQATVYFLQWQGINELKSLWRSLLMLSIESISLSLLSWLFIISLRRAFFFATRRNQGLFYCLAIQVLMISPWLVGHLLLIATIAGLLTQYLLV